MIDRRGLLALTATAAFGAASGGGYAAPKSKIRTKRRDTRGSEARALRTFAENTHPRGLEARDDAKWQASWSKLERSADGLSDGAYFVGMRRALAWFEDGHSTVLPFEYLGEIPPAFAGGIFALRLPWKLKVLDDGVHVVAVSDHHAGILGARIEQIGEAPISQVMRALDASWPGNRAWAQNWAGLGLSSPAQLQGLGVIADPLSPLTVTFANGQSILLRASPDSLRWTDIDRKKSAHETWAESIGRGNYVKPVLDGRALYVSLDDMDDVEGATFEQLTKEVFHAMESPSVERIVVDLRRNGGGNNFLGEPLRKHLERSRFNVPGGLFVMVGQATFSAAQNFASRLERETFATFVGGPTGLAPNHYGDAKMFRGPVTGLTAMVSTLPWFDSYPQDEREWIIPDLLVPSTFDDWQSGRDPALDAALSHQLGAPADDLARDRIFYFRRRSQNQQWKPFWL